MVILIGVILKFVDPSKHLFMDLVIYTDLVVCKEII